MFHAQFLQQKRSFQMEKFSVYCYEFGIFITPEIHLHIREENPVLISDILKGVFLTM